MIEIIDPGCKWIMEVHCDGCGADLKIERDTPFIAPEPCPHCGQLWFGLVENTAYTNQEELDRAFRQAEV